MRLKKVSIGADRYIHKFKRANGTIVEVLALKSSYDNLAIVQPTLPDLTWISSSIRIGFDTPTGLLSDGEYATQENGFHWVKLADRDMTRILPEYIAANKLSDEGVAKVYEQTEND